MGNGPLGGLLRPKGEKVARPGVPPLPVKPIQVHTDKVTRASSTTRYVESGRVFPPEGQPWVGAFIEELPDFPNVEHDDQADAFSLVMIYFRKGEMGNYFLEWMKGQVQEQAKQEMEQQRPRP